VSQEIVIPDKPAFKSAEVCELLKVPPYVLRSWENEFKDLGVSKTASGPRVYRREDVARALRIRHLVLTEGLTLAGVRRRLDEESGAASAEDVLIAEIVASSTRSAAPTPVPMAEPDAAAAAWRQQAEQVRSGLRAILETLSRPVAATSGATRAGTPVASATPARTAGRRTPSSRLDLPAPEPVPPARELVVEPEPAEPSLFADGDESPCGEVSRATDAATRGRRRAGGRAVSD
jgi:DNA-binding transcriptional MerR regulator